METTLTKTTDSLDYNSDLRVERFWKLIEQARVLAAGDEDFLAELKRLLGGLSLEELGAFERVRCILSSKSYSRELWGAADIANQGCSDDAFDDFRDWLMSRGQRDFEIALNDPDALATFQPPYGELVGLDGIAEEIYEERTGSSFPSSVYEGIRSEPLSPAWNFDSDAEMSVRYPRLFRLRRQS